MQSFDIVQMRWIFLMLSGGVVLTLVLLLGFFGRSLRESAAEAEESEPRGDGAHYREPHAIPWFLLLIWVGAGLFIVGYCLWVALGRTNF
ncbi:MAG: hypothetical protein ACE5JM_16585 [Armatimonadota bacterium]